MGFITHYWRAISGPWWANLVGGVATVVPVALAILNSGNAWMWLAISLGVVVMAQVAGAYRQWRRLNSAPTLAIVGQGVKTGTVFKGDPTRSFSVAFVLIANEAHSDRADAEARNVRAVVIYLDADDSVLYRGIGRWSEKDEPSTRPIGYSTDDLDEITIRANGVPYTLEVALKYDDELVAYPFGNENYEAWRAAGEPSLALPGRDLPRTTRVEIGAIGSGVRLSRQAFFVRVADDRLEIEPC